MGPRQGRRGLLGFVVLAGSVWSLGLCKSEMGIGIDFVL